MKRIEALSIAQNLVEALTPFCEQIQIAGSLRRGSSEVKDIEIVAIPRLEIKQMLDMFGHVLETREISALDNALELAIFPWQRDEEVKRWGPRYKRLRHITTGICCDLFITDCLRWGYQLTIRTGPAMFSKAIVTLALRRGWHFTDSLLHKHQKHNDKVCERGGKCTLLELTLEERDIFKALSIPWCEPADRSEEWLWNTERNRVVESVR